MHLLETISLIAGQSNYADQVNLILASPSPCSRSIKAGHITASGLVIRGDKALLILHPHIRRWFQPGGHIDEGESPIQAAIREVYEETGLVCELDSDLLEPLDIDIHEIPPNPKKGEEAHLHIDLLYKLKVIREEESSEDIACKWFTLDEIENARIKRALSKLSA